LSDAKFTHIDHQKPAILMQRLKKINWIPSSVLDLRRQGFRK